MFKQHDRPHWIKCYTFRNSIRGCSFMQDKKMTKKPIAINWYLCVDLVSLGLFYPNNQIRKWYEHKIITIWIAYLPLAVYRYLEFLFFYYSLSPPFFSSLRAFCSLIFSILFCPIVSPIESNLFVWNTTSTDSYSFRN